MKKLIIVSAAVLTTASALLVSVEPVFAGCKTDGDGNTTCEEKSGGTVGFDTRDTETKIEGNHSGSVDAFTGDDKVENNGSVSGDLMGAENNDTVVNNGTVGGDISDNWDTGDDVIVNNGAVKNDVEGGVGDDEIDNNRIVGDDITGGPGNDEITNNGLVADDIRGDGDDEQADWWYEPYGSEGKDGDDIITNNGTVEGDIRADGGSDEVINNGVVEGSIRADGGNDVVVNNGSVEGNIKAHSGEDEIVNSGFVEGDIQGNRGNDSVTIEGEAEVGGIIDGGPGTDILIFNLDIEDHKEYQAFDNALAEADPQEGSLSFAEKVFRWLNFEALRNDSEVPEKPIDANGSDEGDDSDDAPAPNIMFTPEEGTVEAQMNPAVLNSISTVQVYCHAEEDQWELTPISDMVVDGDSGLLSFDIESTGPCAMFTISE